MLAVFKRKGWFAVVQPATRVQQRHHLLGGPAQSPAKPAPTSPPGRVFQGIWELLPEASVAMATHWRSSRSSYVCPGTSKSSSASFTAAHKETHLETRDLRAGGSKVPQHSWLMWADSCANILLQRAATLSLCLIIFDRFFARSWLVPPYQHSSSAARDWWITAERTLFPACLKAHKPDSHQERNKGKICSSD